LKRKYLLVLLMSFVLILSACTSEKESPLEIEEDISDIKTEDTVKEVVLFFKDREGIISYPEFREIELSEQGLAYDLIKALMEGPKDETLIRTIPPETTLISVSVESSVAYVNFAEGPVTQQGGAGESATINSIVLSLTELEEVDAVLFMINGEMIETLAGHIDTAEAIYRNEPMYMAGSYELWFNEERASILQERVDIEPWRLDPLEVAMIEGRGLGFTTDDEFSLLELGEQKALVRIERPNASYVLELVQPFNEGIWVISMLTREG